MSKVLSLLILVIFLAACGGSESSSTDDPNASPDQDALPTSFTLSGELYTRSGLSVDDDVQTNSFETQNNLIASAQSLESYSKVGGYISGSSGYYSYEFNGQRYSYNEDLVDVYDTILFEGQLLKLDTYFADTESSKNTSSQVTLTVYQKTDADPVVSEVLTIDESGSTSLTIDATGEYLVAVSVNEEGSPYLYTLDYSSSSQASGLSQSAGSDYRPIRSLSFVPGEVLVKSKSNYIPQSDIEKSKRSAQNDSNSMDTNDASTSKWQLVKLSDLQQGVRRSKVAQVLDQDIQENSQMSERLETLGLINDLRSQNIYEWVEPNYLRKSLITPSDPLFSSQWHYSKIGLPDAWDVATGEGVTVAVIDTGVDVDHPDLIDNLLLDDAYDFIRDSASAGDGDGADSNPDDLAPTSHGSHVTGIVSAVNNNIGLVGSAYNAKILPLRVLGVDGFGNDADIAQAIRYAAGLSNTSGRTLDQAVDIINLSLGSEDYSSVLRDAINEALLAGVTIVAAAGNNASDTPFYPAAFNSVISVGAVSENNSLASFSNYGSTIDLVAPGGSGIYDTNFDNFYDGIFSTLSGAKYGELQGTSMAAPHVAGVIALVLSVNPELQSSDIRTAISDGLFTKLLGSTYQYGAGIIDAVKAVSWAGADIDDSVDVYPESLSLTSMDEEASISVSEYGNGDATVIAVGSNVDWLTIREGGVQDDGIGRYAVNIDESEMTLNTRYNGEISVIYQLNQVLDTIVVPVSYTKTVKNVQSQVGEVFVTLVRRQDQETAEQNNSPFVDVYSTARARLVNGRYQFTFLNIPSGEYILDASTDNDNDYIVSDEGEAIGAYPLYASPSILTVTDSDISGLDFEVDFFTELAGAQSSDQSGTVKKLKRISAKP